MVYCDTLNPCSLTRRHSRNQKVFDLVQQLVGYINTSQTICFPSLKLTQPLNPPYSHLETTLQYISLLLFSYMCPTSHIQRVTLPILVTVHTPLKQCKSATFIFVLFPHLNMQHRGLCHLLQITLAISKILVCAHFLPDLKITNSFLFICQIFLSNCNKFYDYSPIC